MGAGDAFHQLRGLAAIGRLGVKCLELGPGVNQAEQADCPHLIAIQGLRHQFDAAALRNALKRLIAVSDPGLPKLWV